MCLAFYDLDLLGKAELQQLLGLPLLPQKMLNMLSHCHDQSHQVILRIIPTQDSSFFSIALRGSASAPKAFLFFPLSSSDWPA